MVKLKFDVQGMTCSSCSSHVEKAVRKLDGIGTVTVNLLSNNMIVEFDENKVNANTIIAAVVTAGYGASLAEEEFNYLNNNIGAKNKNSINNNNENTKQNDIHSKAFMKNSTSKVNDNIKSMKKRLIASICFWLPLMYIAMHNMLYNMFGIPVPKFVAELFDGTQNALAFALTQLLLTIPIVYINRNYFITGFKRLIKKAPTMDSLIAIGSSAAIIYGIYALYMISYGLGHNELEIVNKFSADLYFESAGTILTLISFGKFLETKSKGKTSAAIEKLINLSPKTAIVLKNGQEHEVPTEEILKDDIIIIKPGSRIPVDGVIIEGSSSIDQSSITGESIPVDKVPNDTVVSGTINKNGYFKMKATKVGSESTLAQIIKLVEEAGNSKAPIAKIADKVSGIFVPTVILIAILATFFWLLNGQSFEFALSIGISVLVISCPCALGLATPVAIMVGMGKGATQGILIKSAENLEMLHSVDTVVLDKTGTITTGKPKVIDVVPAKKISQKELLQIAANIEKNSEHSLAEAIVEKAKEENIILSEVRDFTYIPGRGVEVTLGDKKYLGGNIAFMIENRVEGFKEELFQVANEQMSPQNSRKEDLKSEINQLINTAEDLLKQGKTVLYFAENNNLIGIISVADTIKPTSYDAIKGLKDKKIDVVMLTGDNGTVAKTIASELGINNVISEVLPQDKEREVAKLQSKGKRVAFVGDGVNDSPALVRADVGIAIGSGTDIAIESADVVLKNDNLLSVVTAIDLSKAVMRNIKMNLFWAFFYNCIGIPIAAGAFYLSHGLKLNPMLGAAAMSLSSVCVVTNALTLNFFKEKNNKSTSIEEKQIHESKQLVNELNKGEDNMENITKEIIIEGMQCNHCKMTVEKVLNAIDGVTKTEVNLENKSAIIESTKEIDNGTIKEVIEEAGFEVKEIK